MFGRRRQSCFQHAGDRLVFLISSQTVTDEVTDNMLLVVINSQIRTICISNVCFLDKYFREIIIKQ